MRLHDKTCIITGAASGIGYRAACAFAREGAQVIAVDVNAHGLEELSAKCEGIEARTVDVLDPSQVDALIGSLARVDVLFNCAGRVPVGNILECSPSDWASTFELNVTAIFRLTQAVLPTMLSQAGGSIINMASVISSIGGAPERFAYGASKGAVIAMTKSVAKDFAEQGIRCNAICPSAVETPSMTARIAAMDEPDTARQMFSSRQPVGRMGTPEEIAHLAVYLASDESRFTTGSAMVIDGGAKL